MHSFRTVAGLVIAGALAGTLAVPALAATSTNVGSPSDSTATSTKGGTASGAKDTEGTSSQGSSAKANDPESKADKTDSSSTKNGGDKAGDIDLSPIPEEAILSVDELYEMLGGEELDKAARAAKGKGASTGLSGDISVIDVRSLAIFSELHVPGAKCVPAGRVFEIRMREVPRDETVILIDEDGSRLVETWQALVDNDYDPEKILVVEGGFDAWIEADYPAEETPIRLGC